MAKVIEQFKLKQFKLSDQDGDIDILLYCDDDEGYGVEIIDGDSSLADYAFGNNSVECHNMAYCWFNTLRVMYEETDDAFITLLYPSIILPEDKLLSEDDLDIVYSIIADIYDTLGGHPLNEIILDDVRSYYDSDTKTPLWVSQVQGIE